MALSACDTGKGATDYFEGLEGLPRAFYVAGARNVLVALWPIGDLAAKNFMERFYETWLPADQRPRPRASQDQARLHLGVRPCRWTGSGGGFDRGAGVAVLELDGAEIAQGGV